MALHAEPPPAAPWARALELAGNGKFAATAQAYVHAGLADEGSVGRLVDANVEFTYRYYCRLARLRYALPRRLLASSIEDASADPLREVVARGRGAVLVSAHLGDFDVAGAWLAGALGCEVVVTTDPVAQAARQAWFDSVRRASGVILRRRDRTRLADLEADLRRGRIVLWMLDRAARGPAVAGRLLGRRALLPIAPAMLARRTGAVLVCGTTTTGADGTRLLQVGRPLDLNRDGQAPRAALDAVAETLSEQIRACPWQWHIPSDLGQLALAGVGSAETGPVEHIDASGRPQSTAAELQPRRTGILRADGSR